MLISHRRTVFLAASVVFSISCAGTTQFRSGTGPSGTVVVSNMQDNTATLLDAATGRVVATLPTGQGPHEVATSHDGRWALVSNYGGRGNVGSTITVIDVAAKSVARTIDLGQYRRPHGMAFFPGDSLVAVTSEASRVVLVVALADGTVRRALPTNGRGGHMLAMSSLGDRLVVGNIADATIALIDPADSTKTRLIKVGRQPEGVAISPDGLTAWAGSNQDSIVVVVDLRSGQPADTLRGFGLPYRIVISPDGKHAVVSDPVKAQVRIFDATTRRPTATVQVPNDSLVATAEVPGSSSPEGVAISRDSRFAFVTLQGRNRVVAIDLTDGRIVTTGVTGTWSDGVAWSQVRQ
jgi:YVTN family beta-propeller protein